jgi:hypothetical protein
MHVQKTVVHQGKTITHGSFGVRETVHVCAARCRHPSGALVTRQAQRVQQLLLPGRTVSYDVMVYVGTERFVHHRQREEIRAALEAQHDVVLSTGTISDLTQLFGQYLRALHEHRADALRAALQADGGYPMHIDATGENGRGTLLVTYAGWRRWVLGAWKIPTERADVIVPRLREVTTLFGPPCAIVRDLGRAMIPAAKELVAELNLAIPILACHAHFLSDVGKDLLEASHDALRKLFRRHKTRPALRTLARELGRKIGEEIDGAREAVLAWQRCEDTEHRLPEGRRNGLGVLRALAQWVLDYRVESTGADFPFDRPYLDLYERCVRLRRCIDALLRTPPENKQVRRTLWRLARIVDPVAREDPLTEAARTLRRRTQLFDELRTALRLQPRDDGQKQPTVCSANEHEIQDIRAAVEQLVLSLRQRRPRRGPAEDSREAIDLVLDHLDRHGDSLWGHVVKLPAEAGGGVRLVARTNNLIEGFNRALKQAERRRSGRKILSDDLEHLPPEAALARNLLCSDYVEILCGARDQLPKAFAKLDEDKRAKAIAATSLSTLASATVTPQTASASLPKPDRRLVRSEPMLARIMAAAQSRAPRLDARSPA